MIDLRFIREYEEDLRRRWLKKGEVVDLTRILELDSVRRSLIAERDGLRRDQRLLSEGIAQAKRIGEEPEELYRTAKQAAAKVKKLEERLLEVEVELEERLLELPNPPHPSVPEETQVIREEGEPPRFDFQPLTHWELGAALGILDFPAAARVAGARFVLYKGAGARLERALIDFCLDLHTQHGYTEILPPVLNPEECGVGSGQLPRLKNDMYQLKGYQLYLAPTAEVPLVNLHRGEIVKEEELPLSYVAYTPCFRREAGSYGQKVRGMIRVHQFDKVELVKFTRPEDSYEELDRMVEDVVRVMEALELPYRVKLLGARELGFQSAKTYDVECWAAGLGEWLEVSSISNCEAFQARRTNTRFRRKHGGLDYPHILNGSGVAFPRTFIALLENNQQSDGTIRLPKALWRYMGQERIG